MYVLKQIAKFIGWLSGSLAGIAAILTVCGYLITISNLNLLGLDLSILEYNPEFYLRKGGNFVFYIVNTAGEKILLPIIFVLVPLSVVLSLFLSVIKRSPLYNYINKIRERCTSYSTYA